MTSALSCPDLLGLLTPRWRSRARCPTSVKMWQPWIPFLLRLQRPISAYPSGIPSGWDPSLLIFALRSPMALSSSPMANHKSAKMQLVARRTLRSGRLIWLMFNMKQCINWGEGQGSAPMASNNGNWTQLYWKRRVFPKLKKNRACKSCLCNLICSCSLTITVCPPMQCWRNPQTGSFKMMALLYKEDDKQFDFNENVCWCHFKTIFLGGFLCCWAVGWKSVPAVGHGLRDHKGEGHTNKGQWWCLVSCWYPERWPLRSVMSTILQMYCLFTWYFIWTLEPLGQSQSFPFYWSYPNLCGKLKTFFFFLPNGYKINLFHTKTFN